MQTEKFQHSSRRVIPETKKTSFSALSVHPQIGRPLIDSIFPVCFFGRRSSLFLGQLLRKEFTQKKKVSFSSTFTGKKRNLRKISFRSTLKEKNTQLEEKSLLGQLLKKKYAIRGKVSFGSTLKEKNTPLEENLFWVNS